jgi:hypothetical protein
MQSKRSHYLVLFSPHPYTACCLLDLCMFVLGKKRGPISVAWRSKAWVFGRSHAGIAGSNSAVGMDICLLWILCVVG